MLLNKWTNIYLHILLRFNVTSLFDRHENNSLASNLKCLVILCLQSWEYT